MMNKIETKKLLLYIFIVAVLFLLPICTIIVNTDTLEDGNEFLFKVEAFDPYDMFRGNYLDIDFLEDSVNNDETYDMNYGERCYATIKIREDGFAYFDKLTQERPRDTSDYYETTARYGGMINTPTRYYMNENKSLDAEKVYEENLDNTYVKVRVKNGKMVIVGVFVDGVLIDTIEPQEK